MKSRLGTVLGIACVVVSGGAHAATLVWTNKSTSAVSWGTAGNWDHAPVFDGTEDAVCNASTDITSLLDGSRSVNSLSIGGSRNFKVNAGSPTTSRLILKSGNLTVTNTYYWSASAAIQVDDGTTANPNAVWHTGAAGNNRETNGKIYGLEDTMITKTGTVTLILWGDSGATYPGKWSFTQGTTIIGANSALGRGKVFMRNGALLQTDGTFVISNDVDFASSAGLAVAAGKSLTVPGDLSGAGAMNLGNTGNKNGALRLLGTNNTHSGGVAFFAAAQLVLGGTWTNAGTVALYNKYAHCSLQGNGYLGLGAGRKVYSLPQFDASFRTFIAPGDGTAIFAPTNGTIGVLTLGTPGNGNSVEFGNSNAWLVVDATATTSDTLVVNGTLDMSGPNNALHIFGTLAPTRTYTFAQFTARNGKFGRVFLNTVPVADPESKNGVNGTHTLVYSATSLQLVAPGSPGTVLLLK